MSTVNFESSQYVSVEFSLASSGQRLLAAMIDMAVFFVYFLVIIAFLGESMIFRANSFSEIFWLFIVKLPWIFYNPICEYFMNGQTLGKYIVGVRIVTINGDRPKLKEVFTRWIFKGDFLWISANFLIFVWFGMGVVAIAVIGLTSNRQRLADVLSNTIAIKTKQRNFYTLKDVLTIKNSANHEIKYPQVVRFTDEDMMLIKNTIIRLRKYPTPETIKFGKELCAETTRLMGIEPIEKQRLEFLENVLQDYVVLTR